MNIALITGSAGLVGSAAAREFSALGYYIIGIDNDMRAYFFGPGASTAASKEELVRNLPQYSHQQLDIRDRTAIDRLFAQYGSDIKVIVHAAAQPSHDWAAREPFTDFTVNAEGTLVMLEATRNYAPDATFIFLSTNKVYGDAPNYLPLVEQEARWELDSLHPYFKHGIDESFSIDHTKHSLFGASKVAADILVQEYGLYFGMKTGIFRCGCLTGPAHAGAMLHGFLSYLMQCVVKETPYTVFGYKGKQVRDNIHADDLAKCFSCFAARPRSGEVYNMGGGRFANCSMIEAIKLSEKIAGKKLQYTYSDSNRIGDHMWWISDTNKFKRHYPEWDIKKDIHQILMDIFEHTSK